MSACLRTFKRLVLPAFFYVFALSACDSKPKRVVTAFSGPTMGTTYNIKLISSKALSAEKIQALVDAELKAINQSMSTYISDSELSTFNRLSVNEAFSVSKSLCLLIEEANYLAELTAGRYDVTVGPLVNLWGFGPEQREGIPTKKDMDAALAKVDFKALEVDCAALTLSKKKPVYVDLSSSAKGMATDKIAELLREQGFADAMVEIGGELHVIGKNAEALDWRIAVEKPSLGHSGSVQVLQVSDVAVATSGDYRNYYEVDGQRVSHTIDPTTAMPITHNLASVTVIAATGSRADAWATALNVLGPEEGFELALSQKLAAYFIVREGENFTVKYTPEFKRYMVNL